MSQLPILLSIPHGGMTTPAELTRRLALSTVNIHDDIDPFTQEIYDIGDVVAEVVTTDIARTFVDMNRATDDRPPANPDGVIKSTTCNGAAIYKEGQEPDGALISTLLTRYYNPYHQRLQTALRRSDVEFALDCHSMQAVGPAIAPDTGEKRPMVCLGNRDNRTCSLSTITHLAKCFRQAFELKISDVMVNRPFSGGYITRTYGGNPAPWIQVELNRTLYLDPAYFDRKTLTMDQDRLQELNRRFEYTMQLFWG